MKTKNKRRSFRILALVLCLVLICPYMLGMAMANDAEAAENDSPELAEVFVISEIDEEEADFPADDELPVAEIEIDADEPVFEETDAAEPAIIEEWEDTEESDVTMEPEITEETDTTAEPESIEETEPAEKPDPTTESEFSEEPEPVVEPESTAEPEIATDPESTAEPEATEEPSLAPEYELSHSGDEEWTNAPVILQIRIKDLNSSGWTKVEAADSKDGDRTELTEELSEKGFANYTVSKNCTVHVFITDTEGTEHIEKFSVSCFDYAGPSVTAGIDNTLLRVEAVDTQSGVQGIYVNDKLYTSLENGVLNLPASENTKDKDFKITAVDNLGNESKTVTISNPFYKKASTTEHSNNCPPDCDCRSNSSGNTQTQTPTTSTSQGQSGNSGNTSQAPAAQTPVTQTPAPVTVSSSETPAAAETKTDTTDSSETANEQTSSPEPVIIEPGAPFSESGNFITRDLLYDKYTNKQFIVVETRNGATFYMVIDYDKPLDEDGERYETYFLNMVDEADLLALLDDGTQKTPVCTCTDKCEPGHVNTSCEVCRNNMSECIGKEPVTVTPEPTVEPEPETEPEPEKSSGSGVLIVLLLLALAGGGVLYWFKFRKEKPKAKGPIDRDDYDYGEDDDEDYEVEPDDADMNEMTNEGDNDDE